MKNHKKNKLENEIYLYFFFKLLNNIKLFWNFLKIFINLFILNIVIKRFNFYNSSKLLNFNYIMQLHINNKK